MALLPDRHPQKDFFILDIADVVLKDDMASMEHPLFSLATKPDHRHLEYRGGGNAPLKKSRLNIRQIIEGDHLPFYTLELTSNDLVIFRPRQNRVNISADIVLPEWAEEKARGIAREKGWDYHALRANWMVFAQAETGKGNPPLKAGAAFVAYCNKQDSLR